jgi:formylglycine-generating enzyme required for sulfatase activity/DNA-binding winged helix-turn-helix (wHTH) protein
MHHLLSATPQRYRFGAFEADTRSAELRLNGEIVPIQDVPFRFLVALLERPGEVVSREQLRERIWPPDLHLDFEKSLDTAAFRLRHALGDSARNPLYVETLPGKGFRFLGEVLAETDAPAVPSPRESQLISALSAIARHWRISVTASALILAMVSVLAWHLVQESRVHWALTVALPEMTRLIEQQRIHAAFRLARQAERYLPGPPQIQALRRDFLIPVTIRTTPAGAQVFIKDYVDMDGAWELLGRTPLESVPVPRGELQWRIILPGYAPIESAFTPHLSTRSELVLDPLGSVPEGMVHVRVPAFLFHPGPMSSLLADYWIDKFDVTNREFKTFIDHGGYRDQRYWQHPFVRGGQTLSWEEALAQFRDTTGRPGPATWELGTYPEGQADFPVTGVSWYEAAAYASFAGKELPTVAHWRYAAGYALYTNCFHLSNFSGKGMARVGAYHGLGPFGTYDMAGNAKQWCLNAVGEKRYILGGAWNETAAMSVDPDARDPFDRSATFGFRCVKYQKPPAMELLGPYEWFQRDYSREKPVGDDVFHIYQRLYLYQPFNLDAKVVAVDASKPNWRMETVSFRAAYGNERVTAYLFLPNNAKPPFQTVVYFPSGTDFGLDSSKTLDLKFIEFLIRSGRALLYPVYQGTYERQIRRVWTFDGLSGLNIIIQDAKDLKCSLDYLETRPDIDRERLAFFGLGRGAWWGPIFTAVEQRFKASILFYGGLAPFKLQPEADPLNFAPRVLVPTLMVNGQEDFIFPKETSQLPLFHLLGTVARDKRHVVFEGGFMPGNWQGQVKEALDWLDHYLGPPPGPVPSP